MAGQMAITSSCTAKLEQHGGLRQLERRYGTSASVRIAMIPLTSSQPLGYSARVLPSLGPAFRRQLWESGLLTDESISISLDDIFQSSN